MHIPYKGPFSRGLTQLVERRGAQADMLMDFGILRLDQGDMYNDKSDHDERAWLLASGSVSISWDGGKAELDRLDRFNHDPWCLSVPAGCTVRMEASRGGAELYRIATDNSKRFVPRLYKPADCRSEFRGAGTMRETSTRIVRTIFDDTNHNESLLVLGEVIGVPGKWSSYPPHHHPQPEIYHYRFMPEQGFGLTTIGTQAHVLRDRDTILIRDGKDHPQVTAPGYAMWYLWVIRHLEGNRYSIPEFTEEHRWVTGPQEAIWQPEKQ